MKKYEILFVDDEPRTLQAFERQLKKRFSIRTAGSASEAECARTPVRIAPTSTGGA
jgi:DNA-binding NtrC family response regulator